MSDGGNQQRINERFLPPRPPGPASGEPSNDNPPDIRRGHKQRRAAPSRGGMRCPHCLSPGYRRTSREVTPTYSDQYYVCTEVHCGHTWKAGLSYVHGLSPSAAPNPELNLPMSQLSRAALLERGVGARPPHDPPGELATG